MVVSRLQVKTVIDRIHKWRLSNYSFVVMLIILTSLVSTSKFQKNFCFEVRLVRMITQRQRIISWAPFMNRVYCFATPWTVLGFQRCRGYVNNDSSGSFAYIFPFSSQCLPSLEKYSMSESETSAPPCLGKLFTPLYFGYEE